MRASRLYQRCCPPPPAFAGVRLGLRPLHQLASSRSQWALPDLNCARSQWALRHCGTSIASARCHIEYQIEIESQTRRQIECLIECQRENVRMMSDRMPDGISEHMSQRMSWWGSLKKVFVFVDTRTSSPANLSSSACEYSPEIPIWSNLQEPH